MLTRLFLINSLIFICFSTSACSVKSPELAERKVVVVKRPARIPAGAMRYCWEEPIVAVDRMGPGLDPAGHYYHPSYKAVRAVRFGKWRPCKEVKSETTTGYRR